MSPRRAASGLSLIEVMIAMVLMALVGLMAERGLSQMLRARDQVAAEQQRWRDIAFAFGRLSEDVAFAAQGLPGDADATAWSGTGERLRWVRWGQDGRLLRLDYDLKDGRLRRATAAIEGGTPDPVVVLEGVAGLRLQLLDSAGGRHADWPAEGAKDSRPLAVIVALTLREGTQLQRTFALP